MGRFVQVKVRARVLRTIDKCGGLDGYLLGEKPGRIKELGVEGWRLRWLVMRTGTVRRRVQGEREALGLVGRGGTSRSRQEVKAEESAEADLMLEEEIGRASGEVVEQIGRAPEAPLEAATEAEAEEPGGRVETFPINPPSSKPPALEDRIKRITQAIEDEITRQHAQKTTRSSTATALPSQPDEPGITPSKPPGRVSTKSEERAPREQQALKSLAPDSYRELEIASGKTEIALRAEVARIEEAVEAEMEEAEGDGKGVERLEVAMEMMRSASEELERVKAVKKERVRGKGEKAEGGVLGKIKALFSRR